MIITGTNANTKINHIAQKIADLISSGVSSDKILILCQNSFKKEKILSQINKILFSKGIYGSSQLRISTFSGIAYNSILRNWSTIEKLLEKSKGDIQIYPTLSGLDVSQYFFRKIIKEEDFQDYFSKKNLMHQLLRRYKLIVENSLSDDEISARSNILEESFSQSASKNRIFDNLKQISSFIYLLKNNQIKDFDDIEYFFADDVDEYSYAAFEFCNFMLEKNCEKYLYLDKDGCSRKGYLCAYNSAYADLKKNYNFKELELEETSIFARDIQKLSSNIQNKTDFELANFEAFAFSKRLEMIEAVAQKILTMIKNGVCKTDIQIITPNIDENLIYSLKEFLKPQGIKLQFLTGNKKITEDIYVYSIITVFELLNPQWSIYPNSFDIRILLNHILQIPIFDCQEFISIYNKKGILPDIMQEKYPQYKLLLELLSDEELKGKTLSEQFEQIFARIIAPNAIYGNDFEAVNLLLKSINEYEKLKDNFKKFDNIELTPKDWLLHIKNSVVS